MSRVAKSPVPILDGVVVKLSKHEISAKGKLGENSCNIHEYVDVINEDNILYVKPRLESKESIAQAGTVRANINNLMQGVSKGFEKKLTLVGVGYKAQLQGDTLVLTLGYSHLVHFSVPKNIDVSLPSQTEIIVKGFDKQLVGQVSAEIRSKRPPEPYKGKGVRYSDEVIKIKEGKKK